MANTLRRTATASLWIAAFLTIATAQLLLADSSQSVPSELEASRPATALVGAWQASIRFGPEIEGELVVRRGDPQWTAEIAGIEVMFQAQGNQIEFELPDTLGSFRGRMDGDRLGGHWIQPGGEILSNAFATPVRFEGDASTWSGSVAPLADELTLYLVLRAEPDGSVTGFFRNPDRNVGRFLRFGSVVERQGRIEILDRENEQPMLTGDLRNRSLSIFFPQAQRTFDFHHIEPSARGFAPRLASKTPSLNRPPALGDGWATANPQEQGLDLKPLQDLVGKITEMETDSVSTPYLHSLLVARHGKLVIEQYFHGHDRDQPHDTRSAGKSFGTTLVGVAMDRGLPLSVTTPVYELLAQRAGPMESADSLEDGRRQRMTLEHLLTMSSGLHCDDGDDETPGNEDRMQNQSDEPDWIRYALRLPMAWEPGEHDVYCSADMHLLAGVLGQATGEWVPQLFADYLAGPLQFGRYHMNLDPMGEGYLGGGVRLRARDFLKLGQVFLDGGMWNGKRVLSTSWIDRAVTAHSSLNEPDDYGYGWWIADSPWQGKQLRTFYASGNGGQLVIVVPELELVVAFQAANYSDYRTWRAFREQWLPEFILAAIPEADVND